MNSTEMNLPFLIYFILCAVMSAAAFVAMGADKRLAQTHQRRIPEKHLFLLSILFGGIGGTIGMFPRVLPALCADPDRAGRMALHPLRAHKKDFRMEVLLFYSFSFAVRIIVMRV